MEDLRHVAPSKVGTLPILFLCLISPPSAAEAINSASTSWILTATGLLLFVTIPGLALFYGGLVRTRNALSAIFPCFAIAALVSILWLVCGYSLAFTSSGDPSFFIGGFSRIFLRGLSIENTTHGVPESVFAMYQLAFAIFAPTLIVGSLVERVKLPALLLFALLWSLLVYTPIAHWIWGGGWLQDLGVLDFSGGIVIHAASGVGALTSAWVLGPRRGFPSSLTPPHNLTLCAAGTGMVWVGWHGFAPGHELATNGLAGIAMLNTHIAGTVASLTWMGIEWYRQGRPTFLGIATGLIAGLGIISSGAGYLTPTSACLCGILAGCIGIPAIQWIKVRLEVDDALDIFAVHGLSGIAGALLTALLVSPSAVEQGHLNDQDFFTRLGIQLIAITSVMIWSGTLSHAILTLLDKTIVLRVTPDEETEGLDLVSHQSQAYHLTDGR